jgi:ABC-type Fe3+/spermidine/putrescine transport system ATPase subunit
MTRVVVEGLVKKVDRVAVVDGASLEVRPGELSVVLGPSGAGKTMLARLIAGLEAADDGEIYFDGRAMMAVPPEERRVGLMFQDDALWPHLSVAENVGYGLRARGMARKEARQRVAEVLGMVRVEGLADKRPDALTDLHRRQVALARSLVIEPDLLLLDEPLGTLEPRLRAELREELRRIHAESETTMLILTNQPRDALALADRLSIMDLGRIVQAGTPEDVYNRPADAFVAKLLGPVNLLQGQSEGSDARGEVVVRTPIGRLVGVTANGPIEAGTPVTVVIRPEAFGLGTTVPVGANRFLATLERQMFLGETRMVRLRGPNDWPVQALALQSQSHGLREGQTLTVSITPEQIVVLPSKFAIPRSDAKPAAVG